MDTDLMKAIISRFDRNAFEEFFQRLINQSNTYPGKIDRLSDIDDCIFECPPDRFYQSTDAFFIYYLPYTLYKKFALRDIDYVHLKKLIQLYISIEKNWPWLPIDGITLYIINNFDSEKLGISDNELLSFYENKFDPILPSKLYRVGTGNINTFVRYPEQKSELYYVLRNFLLENDNGICISLSDSGIYASRFLAENEFTGVTKDTKSIIQPIMKKLNTTNDILCEFNRLIFSNTKERDLEDFLREHYQTIFGGKYDQISTQVWLRFSDIDIGRKERRLDMFLRNSICGDWELFELKRSNIPLTKTISDVPMFVSAVNEAIAQVKNYKHILMQDKVKKALAAEGIEYYEPEVNLVIGKKPSIPINQWRRLLVDNMNGIKIITYDMLYEEAKRRLIDLEAILK